ncbi:MAG: hypothetical protein NTV74_02175 [Euryarchaeota archaeon]|nr:hypothetical protein [Euryarchaeota archaeon]
MKSMNNVLKGNILLVAPLMLSFGGISLLTAVDVIEYIGLFALASVAYACFFYWFASSNKKIDIYVQPKIFNWKIKTALLLLGTIIILVPVISFGIIGGGILIPTMVVFYLIFLIGLVVCPVILLLIFLATGGLLAMNLGGLLGLFYWSYAAAIVMIFLVLFVTARQAVDTLILRIKEIGNFDTANHMENYSRIGIGSFLIFLVLPLALFTRCIRRATKTGLVKITLSVTPSGFTPRGDERWTERWTTVNLERMSESHQEVMTRIDSMNNRFTKT